MDNLSGRITIDDDNMEGTSFYAFSGKRVFGMNQRYLTKSRFKIGLECPTKLYYEGRQFVYNGFLLQCQ